MPLFKTSTQLIYFAHVPKCAGTSIEMYLEERFGSLAFVDRGFNQIPISERWNQSSPQHIPVSAMDRMFPDGFLDASFAMVRHPVDRIVSAFQFQLEWENSIASGTTFSTWLAQIEDQKANHPFIYDNHIRTMDNLVPTDAIIFKLEDGTDPVIAWLDERDPTSAMPDVPIPVLNTREHYLNPLDSQTTDFIVTTQDRALIEQIYKDDFERFGYE